MLLPSQWLISEVKQTNQIHNMNSIKLILTGATGMVGEGVLHECLHNEKVKEVLIINRKPSNIEHPKLKEIVHKDFYNFTNIEEQLIGYDACLFCLGISSVGMQEKEYAHLTYGLTLNFAETLSKLNSNFTFCYISGAGTDSTEKGKVMWARVKGRTENALTRLPFKAAYNFRPGALIPTKGLKNTLVYYKYLGWLIPIIKIIAPNSICSLKELGNAMLNVCFTGYQKSNIEVNDMKLLSKAGG